MTTCLWAPATVELVNPEGTRLPNWFITTKDRPQPDAPQIFLLITLFVCLSLAAAPIEQQLLVSTYVGVRPLNFTSNQTCFKIGISNTFHSQSEHGDYILYVKLSDKCIVEVSRYMSVYEARNNYFIIVGKPPTDENKYIRHSNAAYRKKHGILGAWVNIKQVLPHSPLPPPQKKNHQGACGGINQILDTGLFLVKRDDTFVDLYFIPVTIAHCRDIQSCLFRSNHPLRPSIQYFASDSYEYGCARHNSGNLIAVAYSDCGDDGGFFLLSLWRLNDSGIVAYARHSSNGSLIELPDIAGVVDVGPGSRILPFNCSNFTGWPCSGRKFV